MSNIKCAVSERVKALIYESFTFLHLSQHVKVNQKFKYLIDQRFTVLTVHCLLMSLLMQELTINRSGIIKYKKK